MFQISIIILLNGQLMRVTKAYEIMATTQTFCSQSSWQSASRFDLCPSNPTTANIMIGLLPRPGTPPPPPPQEIGYIHALLVLLLLLTTYGPALSPVF